MAMKKNRLAKILELIEEYEIDTQEAMQSFLADCGITVTQATVSRDIKELRLTKVPTSSGGYRYAVPQVDFMRQEKIHAIFIGSVVKIDYALNTVVIKCEVGMAMAACASFDAMDYPDVVGTLAGDDTIFILMRTEECAKNLYYALTEHIAK